VIELVGSENGNVVDRLEFDTDNIVHYQNGVAVVHPRIMHHCTRPDVLWYRIAHAAAWVAETGSALDALRDLKARGKAPPTPPGRAPDDTDEQFPSPRPIEDDDLYRLQRDPRESEEDYLPRCEMLGCDRQGFVRLPRQRR
jgi:hypothetical protein